MQYEPLGRSGLKVSKLCLGTASFGVAPREEDAIQLVHEAIDLGINFVDVANSYGNQPRFDRAGAPTADARRSAEEIVGRALRGRRDEVVLATKVSEPMGSGPNDSGLGRQHVMRMVEQSLLRLQTDYLDIYYAHHPDPLTDPKEWIETFDILIAQGKIRHYAVSTFSGWELSEAVLTADAMGVTRPICHQTRYSVAKKWAESEVLPASERFGLSTSVFSPLGGGLLTGATDREYGGNARWGGAGFTGDEISFARRFADHAQEWDIRPAHAALAWLFSKPTIASAIVGPESALELRPLLDGVEVVLSYEQIAILDELTPHPLGQWD